VSGRTTLGAVGNSWSGGLGDARIGTSGLGDGSGLWITFVDRGCVPIARIGQLTTVVVMRPLKWLSDLWLKASEI
jgi:hypothetical protein